MNKLRQDCQKGSKLKLNCVVDAKKEILSINGFRRRYLKYLPWALQVSFAILLSVVYIFVPLSSSFGFPDENTTWRDILMKENAK